MKISVLSDTHIPVAATELPDELIKKLKGSDLIMHAGDIIDLSVIRDLEDIARVVAVSGNMDLPETQNALKRKVLIEIEGKKIAMMHGHGHPDMLIELLKLEFSREKPDIIIFGHSHSPVNKHIDGVLYFNPGSCTDTIFAPYRSFGVLKIKNGKVFSEIKKIHGGK